MPAPLTFTIRSQLAASTEEVWAHASTFAGVNRELWPLVRMTYPPEFAALTPETITLGKKAFRSWILLFGLLPIEYDDFTLIELEPGSGFYEVSRMLMLREWRHRRTISSTATGCELIDEIVFTPRLPGMGWLLRTVYRALSSAGVIGSCVHFSFPSNSHLLSTTVSNMTLATHSPYLPVDLIFPLGWRATRGERERQSRQSR